VTSSLNLKRRGTDSGVIAVLSQISSGVRVRFHDENGVCSKKGTNCTIFVSGKCIWAFLNSCKSCGRHELMGSYMVIKGYAEIFLKTYMGGWLVGFFSKTRFFLKEKYLYNGPFCGTNF